MKAVAAEARTDPDILHAAPVTTEFGRLDEVTAAREPNLRWRRPVPVEPGDLEYVGQAG
jgi:glycine dehydrogenase subunit 2